MKQKKKINWIEVIEWILIYSLFASLGFGLGMVYQQLLFTQEIGKLLSYTDLEVTVNFNETKLVEEMNRTFIPAWKEAFNQSIQKQNIVKNCTWNYTGEKC